MDRKVDLMDLTKITGIIPILVKADEDDLLPVADALTRAGCPSLEVLLKNEDSYKSIEIIARERPDFAVGAGTVLNVEQAKRVIDLGAKFCVLPGFSQKVVDYCLAHDVYVIPGCDTPTEIMMALDSGLKVVKFFPVFEMGGIPFLKQLNGGPFGDVRFVCTGALDENNFPEISAYPGTFAVGGDWMFTEHQALVRKDYAKIEENMRKSVRTVLDLRKDW